MIFKRGKFGLIAAMLLFPGCGDGSVPDSSPTTEPPSFPVEAETTEGPAPETEISRSDKNAAIDSTYTVAEYIPNRDAAADLAATIERAEDEGKRILLEIGGQW